jgi:hypothetical protein
MGTKPKVLGEFFTNSIIVPRGSRMNRTTQRLSLLLLAAVFTTHSGWCEGTDYDSLIASAKSDLAAGKVEQAAVEAAKAIALDQSRWEGYTLAGGASIKQHRCKEAGDFLQKAIARAPEDKREGLNKLLHQCSDVEGTVVTGWVSDSLCRDKGANSAARMCTKKCIGNGQKRVLVTDRERTVLTVDNQEALEGYEGQHVEVIGNIKKGSIHLESVKTQ